MKEAIRKEVVATIMRLKKQTGLCEMKLTKMLGICFSKFSLWKLDKKKSVNHKTPKSHFATEEEWTKVIEFKKEHMTIGYRRLTWMMIDADVVYLSPSTVYRILVKAALNNKWTKPAGEPKKQGFEQPQKPHEQWHIDISYVNFKGSFLYLICVLDGYSRTLLAWDIRERMEVYDVEIVLWRACDKWLVDNTCKPRIISDNGAQFISGEFRACLREFSITHTRTSVNHPQSNGKLERFHGTAKSECLRELPKFNLGQIKEEFGTWVEHYNHKRLHSAIDYVAPMSMLLGLKEKILSERKKKLDIGRQKRKEYFWKQEQVKVDLAPTFKESMVFSCA